MVLLHGVLGIPALLKFDEAETAVLAHKALLRDGDFTDGAETLHQMGDVALLEIEGQISDEERFGGGALLFGSTVDGAALTGGTALETVTAFETIITGVVTRLAGIAGIARVTGVT